MTAALSGVGSSASDIQSTYIKLLVTQLQNQDPTAPMDDNQMASQLAQLSSLQELENMSSTFQQVLVSQQRQQATEMIGKTVDFLPTGATDVQTGTVSGIKLNDTGATLTVGTYDVTVDQVQAVRD
jgi:flagellar basal-body rod modification protein FlgD